MALHLTVPDLTAALRIPQKRAAAWAPYLPAAFELAEIDDEQRAACFLAQTGHESGGFVYTSEIWGPTKQQKRYERDFDWPWPMSPAQSRTKEFAVNRLAYSLGNLRPGDGRRYAGHGLIQTTGRANHYMTTVALRRLLGESVPDFVVAPQLLAEKEWAALSAALFWRERKLNSYADSRDFITLTKRINGGVNGLGDRQIRYTNAYGVLMGVHHDS